MIRLFRLLWLVVLMPVSALGQPVQVTSGEHDGFTRLVLDYGTPMDWQLRRTTDGYGLRLAGARPAYDLTSVYDPIGRGRLAAVWVDPETGILRIGIGCACHAQPFEFRPGIVVIDLKDGPPPGGSVFETDFEGEGLPGLVPRPPPRPRARPSRPLVRDPEAAPGPADSYDWTVAALSSGPILPPGASQDAPATPATAALPDTDPTLQPLRDVLLHQLSRGAAQGVIDMAPLESARTPKPQAGPLRVHLHHLPGLRIEGARNATLGLTAGGATCFADDQLGIGSWGTDRPVFEQMAEAMTGLMGEFDTPDPAAELRAVRFLLFLGFGAEARQILVQLPTDQPEAGVLNSLAHILDDSGDTSPAFSGMAACDTAAALWAILSDPAPARGEAVDRAAALRAFSALPVHLRRLLGPPLVDRFLDLDDGAAAETVRDAILRAPGDGGPGVALMQARLDLDAGEPTEAERRLEPLLASSGPATPEALVAQVATHLARRAPLDPAQISVLEGLLHERRNSPDAARYAMAVTQGRALAGDFDQAFADLSSIPDAAGDVWSLLGEIGTDSAILSHAVRSEGDIPSVRASVAATLARRLSDLGFANQARDWFEQVPAPDPQLAARIALQTGDARLALRLIAGSEDPAALPLRTEALSQLADETALAAVLASTGEQDGRWRALGRARDWPTLAASGSAPWQAVAAAAIGSTERGSTDPAAPGPLAEGQALLESSARTRQEIADLLGAVAGPSRSGL